MFNTKNHLTLIQQSSIQIQQSLLRVHNVKAVVAVVTANMVVLHLPHRMIVPIGSLVLAAAAVLTAVGAAATVVVHLPRCRILAIRSFVPTAVAVVAASMKTKATLVW